MTNGRGYNIPDDVKEKIFDLKEKHGLSNLVLAQRFGLSERQICHIIKVMRAKQKDGHYN